MEGEAKRRYFGAVEGWRVRLKEEEGAGNSPGRTVDNQKSLEYISVEGAYRFVIASIVREINP